MRGIEIINNNINNFGVIDYLTLIGITLIVYVTHYYYKYFTRVNPLPGPFPFPIVGNLPQYFLNGGGCPKTFAEYNRKKYGDIFEVNMNGRLIYLSRADHIEKLLTPSTKSPYLLRNSHNEGLEEMGITGVGIAFNDDYKSWRFNRQFLSQAILAPKLTQDAIDGTNKLFNEMGTYWNKLYIEQENKKKLDFPRWLNNFTNDMIIMLLTGERSYTMAGYFNTLSDGEKADYPLAIIEDSVKLVEAFHKYLMGFTHFMDYPKLLRHNVPHLKNKSNELLQNIEFINKRLESTVKKRRKEIENTPLDKPLTRDMLTSIITANTPRDVNPPKTVGGEETRPLDDKEIRSLLKEGFIGGTDTTANLTSFVLYYIETYPEVKKKLLKELDTIFQGDSKRPMTEDDYRNLKYCDAIVREVSRVLPIAHSIARFSEKPDEIAGYQWPAGTSYRIMIDAIQKSENYWEEADKFNPDRWIVEGFEPKKYSFIMFGGGLRVCPGRKLAMIEIVCFISWLYRKYEIELADKKAPLKTKVGALVSCSELLINVKLRN